jgi:hypothetical protein
MVWWLREFAAIAIENGPYEERANEGRQGGSTRFCIFAGAQLERAFVLAKGDRHGANKNEIAIFVFSVTAKCFSHALAPGWKRAIVFASEA